MLWRMAVGAAWQPRCEARRLEPRSLRMLTVPKVKVVMVMVVAALVIVVVMVGDEVCEVICEMVCVWW